MTTKQLTKIELGHTAVFLRPDGFVQANATDHTYSIDDIRTIEMSIRELTGNQKKGTLLVANNYTSMDAEARHFLSSAEAGTYSLAEAYVIKSMAQRLLLNFLIQVNGTKTPSKFFTDIDSAVNWLRTFDAEMPYFDS